MSLDRRQSVLDRLRNDRDAGREQACVSKVVFGLALWLEVYEAKDV